MNEMYPYDLNAETAVIGSLILDNYQIGKVRSIIGRADRFYDTRHRVIYKQILNMQGMGMNVDLVTLKDQLGKGGKAEEWGGIDYLVTLVESVPTASNAEFYAQIIKDKAILRGEIARAHETLKVASQDGADPLPRLKRLNQESSENLNEAVGENKINEMIDQAIEEMDRHIDGYEITAGGWWTLDRLTYGLGRGRLHIVAGDVSHGKTAVILNFCSANLKRGIKVNYYTYDVAPKYLLIRLAGVMAKVDTNPIFQPMDYKTDPQMREDTKKAIKDNIYPYENDDKLVVRGYVTLADIESDLIRGNAGMVVIDYVQNAFGSDPICEGMAEVPAIRAYLLECKRLASKYNVAFVVASQFRKRTYEAQKASDWKLDDLLGGGSTKQDPDVIMFVRWTYRETEDPSDIHEYAIRVLKNNIGVGIGKINLHFEPTTQTFMETGYSGINLRKRNTEPDRADLDL